MTSTRRGRERRGPAARTPTRRGTSNATASALHYEVYGAASHGAAAAHLAIVHSRDLEVQVPFLARHCRVVTFDGAATGARTGRGAGGLCQREYAADASRCSSTDTARAVLVASRAARVRPSCSPPSILSASTDSSSSGLRSPLGRAAWARRADSPVERRQLRGLGEVQPLPLAAATTPTSCGSSSRVFTEPHSTKQIEDAVGWGLETTPRDADRRAARRRDARHGAARARGPRALPGARHPRHGRLSARRDGSALAELTGGTLATRGAGHAPHGARSGAGEPADPRLRRASAPPRGAPGARRARRKRALFSRRRSASAMPGVTSRSPTSCARLHPDLEVDWLAQHPVTAVLEARGERVHPASALLANESRTSSRSRPSTTCTLPGAAAHGRDPPRELHGLPRRGARRARTTSGSATRRGSSTTSCTRTRS